MRTVTAFPLWRFSHQLVIEGKKNLFVNCTVFVGPSGSSGETCTRGEILNFYNWVKFSNQDPGYFDQKRLPKILRHPPPGPWRAGGTRRTCQWPPRPRRSFCNHQANTLKPVEVWINIVWRTEEAECASSKELPRSAPTLHWDCCNCTIHWKNPDSNRTTHKVMTNRLSIVFGFWTVNSKRTFWS